MIFWSAKASNFWLLMCKCQIQSEQSDEIWSIYFYNRDFFLREREIERGDRSSLTNYVSKVFEIDDTNGLIKKKKKTFTDRYWNDS